MNKYPQPIGTNTTVMDIEEALKLKYWYDLGKVYIRGRNVVPPIPIIDNNECDDNSGCDFNPEYESDNMEIEKTILSRSQKTSVMFENDEEHRTTTQLTQDSQQKDVESLLDMIGPKSQIGLAIYREAMNKAGNDPELIDFLIEKKPKN